MFWKEVAICYSCLWDIKIRYYCCFGRKLQSVTHVYGISRSDTTAALVDNQYFGVCVCVCVCVCVHVFAYFFVECKNGLFIGLFCNVFCVL